jgi:hypothetical protein
MPPLNVLVTGPFGEAGEAILHHLVDDERYVVGTADGSESVVHEEELAAALDGHADYVTNWYVWHELAPQSPDRWAFLRWLEGAEERPVPERYDALAEGVARTWGELSITVSLGEDGRAGIVDVAQSVPARPPTRCI